MKTVWFTADTHFGHKRIPFYARRFFCLDEQERERAESESDSFRSGWSPSQESVDRMDDHMIDRINSLVAKEDILWHLGDFCWGHGDRLVENARRYRERINCSNVSLVLGNHDSEAMGRFFRECHRSCEIKVRHKHIVLSHYAYSFWNKSHHGSWMLYGHAHGTAESWMDEYMPGRFSMDVGVDNVAKVFGEYRPVSFEEIGTLFSSRKGFHADGNKNQSRALR